MSMIDDDDFDKGMKKVFDQFGGRSKFSNHKLKLIYGAVKALQAYEFETIIDEIVGNNSFAPVLKDFMDGVARAREGRAAINKTAERRAANNVIPPNKMAAGFTVIKECLDRDDFTHADSMTENLKKIRGYACSLCGGDGAVHAKKEDETSYTIFLCSCPLGFNRFEAWPKWGSSFIKQGYISKY